MWFLSHNVYVLVNVSLFIHRVLLEKFLIVTFRSIFLYNTQSSYFLFIWYDFFSFCCLQISNKKGLGNKKVIHSYSILICFNQSFDICYRAVSFGNKKKWNEKRNEDEIENEIKWKVNEKLDKYFVAAGKAHVFQTFDILRMFPYTSIVDVQMKVPRT